NDAIREGVTRENGKLLAQSYVSVYIDATTEEGKKLASYYRMTQGLVISDRTGELQALRLTGAVCAEDLATSLERFSKPDLVVTTTATTPAPVVIPARPSCPNGNCPFAR